MPKENSLKKKITEANFSNLVSYLLYAYQKRSTEKLLAKSILWAKLDMRILQRLALKSQNDQDTWSNGDHSFKQYLYSESKKDMKTREGGF